MTTQQEQMAVYGLTLQVFFMGFVDKIKNIDYHQLYPKIKVDEDIKYTTTPKFSIFC